MPATRNSPRAERKTPASAFPETVLSEPATGWLQVLRNDSWDPATVRILTFHLDGMGVQLASPIPLPKGTKIMVNITLQPPQPISMQGAVVGTKRNGSGSIAVVRFEHQADADRRTLAEFAGRVPAPEQPAMTPADNRRYQRFLKSVPVQYQLLRTDGEIVPGEGQMMTLNIGGGGMKIRVEAQLEVGDLVYLHLPLDQVPFFSLGRVIWLEDSRVADRWVAGLQFVDLSDTEQRRLIDVLSRA